MTPIDRADLDTVEDFKMIARFGLVAVLLVGAVVMLITGLFGLL